MNYGEEFKNLITPLPKEFVEIGLELESIENIFSSTDGSSFTKFVFKNKNNQIRLNVNISSLNGAVSILISKRDENYFFDIDDFFIHINKPNGYIELFFRKDLLNVVSNLRSLISNELKDLLSGKKWERIPRNWLGYK